MKNNTSLQKTIIPVLFAASFLITPVTGSAVEFAGTLDGMSITDVDGTNIPPVASFTYTVTGNDVAFDASGSVDSDGSIVGYKWDFGDTLSGEGVTTTHTYKKEMIVPVTLTIFDNLHALTLSRQMVSTVTNILPMTIDNTPPDFSSTGTWGTSSHLAGFIGDNYFFSESGTGENLATWSTQINISSTYVISASWTTSPSRATNATYIIKSNGSIIDTVILDQTHTEGQYNELGQYLLQTGVLEIILSNDSNGYVIADAILIENVK